MSTDERKLLSLIEPQPPSGIKYMLGDETWMQPSDRSPLRLHCEEWGALGPMELNREIKPNSAGLRVRSTTILAPEGALGFAKIDGLYYWTDRDMFGRSAAERSTSRPSQDSGDAE